MKEMIRCWRPDVGVYIRQFKETTAFGALTLQLRQSVEFKIIPETSFLEVTDLTGSVIGAGVQNEKFIKLDRPIKLGETFYIRHIGTQQPYVPPRS